MLRATLALFFLAVMAITSFAQAQTVDTLLDKDIDSVVVFASKFAERSRRIAQSVSIINKPSTLHFQANTGDILSNTGTVFVQRSQQGGGSPVIRGFEASRVLLMVDGIRLNNAIYRAGHLQNIITVDNAVLDRLEVIYGPSSTLYGSDALGGVVSMFTSSPQLSLTKTNVFLRYTTATEEFKAHADVNIGGAKWASLTSITYNSFGNVTQGKNRDSRFPGFGQVPFIVRTFNGKDSAIANPDPDKQQPAGYKQWDILQKLTYKPNQNISHTLNIQLSSSTNIPRFDRLSEVIASKPSYAQWYYGPQFRLLTAYHFSTDGLSGFFRQAMVNASYQGIEESRYTRRFLSSRRDERIENVHVFGLNVDAKHYSGKNELHLGAESNVNFVQSRAWGRNINTNTLSRISTRYPDGFNSMSYYAVYAQHTHKFNRKLTLNDGIRLNYVNMSASFADTSLMHFPFKSVRQQNLAVSGNVALVYVTSKRLKISFLLNTGFRSPNIDDLGKVFDSRAGKVVVPNPDIKPEYTYNAEINLAKFSDRFSYGASIYYTIFSNAIVTDAFTFNGQDSIIYDGVKSQVLANQNKAKAFVYGFSLNARLALIKNLAWQGVASYTYGRYKHNNVAVPMDHIPPVYGRTSIAFNKSNYNVEAFVLFNGWKRINDYSPSGEDNLQYATPLGMPSWFTLNLKAEFVLTKYLQLHLLAENLLDKNYRYFASGISAPGRSFAFTLKASF